MIRELTNLLGECRLLPNNFELPAREEFVVAAQDQNQFLGVTVFQGQGDVLRKKIMS